MLRRLFSRRVSKKQREKLLVEHNRNSIFIESLIEWQLDLLRGEYKTIPIHVGDRIEELSERIRMVHDRNIVILTELGIERKGNHIHD